MCGINAIYRNDSKPADVEALKMMASTLSHRGPDGAGYAVLANGRVAFAHTRLSIIDLKSGDQPLYNEDGSLCITFNGEIYDYKKHREELEGLGHKFRTHSDTEVLLHLYEEFGFEFLNRVNGEYAFVIWDDRKRTLVAAVDPFGVKPLHYSIQGNETLFASEAKAILARPGFAREIDPDFIIGPLFGVFPDGLCFFKNIRALPAGHMLLIDEHGKMTERPHWVPRFNTDSKIDFESAKSEIRKLTTKAVERRMVADVPVANYLSGGLDSTLVCGLMSQRTSHLKSFNVGFGGTIFDESQLANRIAKHFNAKFETFDCNSTLMAENLPATLYHLERPIVNSNSVGKFLLSRLANSQGYKVVLTGEGADEIFGGYPYFKLEKIWRLKDRKLQNALWSRFQKMEKRSEGMLWQKGARWRSILPMFGYPNVQQVRVDETSEYIDEMLQPDVWLRSTYRTPAEFFEKQRRHLNPSSLDPFNASRYLSFSQLSSYIIPTLGDRTEMAHSIEGRTPFLDRDLVEYALTVPPEHFMRIEDLREKHLLKEAFHDLLPEFLQREHKHPFSAPSWKTMFQTSKGREIYNDYLSNKNLEETGIFNPKFVRLMKIIWTLAPSSLTLWRQIDISMGLFASTLILLREMTQRPLKSNNFPLIVDRTWKRGAL